MDKRRDNKGTVGNKGGRKSKAEEQNLVEKLSPLEPRALEVFTKAINEEKQWAIKMYFEYMYGKPVESKNVNLTGDIPIFDI